MSNFFDSSNFEISFLLAFFQKKWVGVPLLSEPQDEQGDKSDSLYRFKVEILAEEWSPFEGERIRHQPASFERRACPAREKIARSINELVDVNSLSDKEIKDLCKINDFESSWITDRFKRRSVTSHSKVNRREERKNPPLKYDDFNKFIVELQKSDKQCALIAEILWALHQDLREFDQFITLEELLRLQVEGVAPIDDPRGPWIELLRKGFKSYQMGVYLLPLKLWERLSSLINENTIFVFANEKGGPLSHMRVDGQFKKAGQKIGLQVSSLSLRPELSDIGALSDKEWTRLYSKTPSLLNKKGRKSTHSQRDMLNAILYMRRTNCPFRKLPNSFPPYTAVDSWYRRWNKQGFIDQIVRDILENRK